MKELSVGVMAHPTVNQFQVGEVGSDAWLNIGGGYGRIQLFIGDDGAIAQAIIDALTPYVNGNPA